MFSSLSILAEDISDHTLSLSDTKIHSKNIEHSVDVAGTFWMT